MSQFFEGYSISQIPGAIVLSAAISPAALPAGNTNDYNPQGLATAARLRVTTNAAGSTLTGLQAQVSGFLLIIECLGTGDLTLADSSGLSLAQNQFQLPTDFIIPADYSQTIVYDGTDARWRIA